MKILMIAPQPFFEPRGTPISVRQRLTGLTKLGHQVDLATYHIGEKVDLPGLRIYRTPTISSIRSLKVGPSWQKIPLDFLLILKSISMMLFTHMKKQVSSQYSYPGFSTCLIYMICTRVYQSSWLILDLGIIS
jgi:hypothetical protein